MSDNCWCDTCAYYKDFGNQDTECRSLVITEDLYNKHFVNGEKNCPFYERNKDLDEFAKLQEDYIKDYDEKSLSVGKSPYKVLFKINSSKVQELCKKYNWYCNGTANTYNEMLEYCRNAESNESINDTVYRVAKNIHYYSILNGDKNEDIMYIMRAILDECLYSVVSKEV